MTSRFLMVLSACFALSLNAVAAQSISALVSIGQFEAAAEALEAQDPSDTDRAFFVGQVLKAQGRLEDAIAQFRHVLQLDPGYINARRELAHTLLLNREFRAAEFHFRALLRSDPSEAMHAGYRQFLSVIDRNRPASFSGQFALLPSSNVNRGTTNTVFDTMLGDFVINPESQAESGTGAQLGFSGQFRHVIGADSRVQLSWDLSAIRYQETRFNSDTAGVSLSYDALTPQGSWSVAPFYRQSWREDGGSYSAPGLRFSAGRRIAEGTFLSMAVSQEYRSFDTQEYRNGQFSAMQAQITRQIRPNLSFTAGLGWESDGADAEHLAYQGTEVTAALAISWVGGLQTQFGLGIGQRGYDGVFPLTSSARDDDFAEVNVMLRHDRLAWGGFAPQLNCSHLRNRSNVAFYDYQATECQLRLTRDF